MMTFNYSSDLNINYSSWPYFFSIINLGPKTKRVEQ